MPENNLYRTYLNEDGEEDLFTVFIIHGKSNEWKKVKKFINVKLTFATVVLIEESEAGILLDLFKDSIWEDCDCAVAIMSPDEKLENGRFFSRQNVLYEIGYCQGFWDHYHSEEDLECVFLVKEETVEINSDINGFKVIPYTNGKIRKTYQQLETVLENLYFYLDETKEVLLPTTNTIKRQSKVLQKKSKVSLRMVRKK